jgi:MazG family protein
VYKSNCITFEVMEYNKSIQRLIAIMDDLRDGCPWDKKQTVQSLRPLSIEEVYELADAIDKNDWQGIKEELGDILLHLIFYIKIATEQQQFILGDVIESICNKLVHRHPHIYSNIHVKDAEEVSKNWEKLKMQEGKKSLLQGVPNALPALVKALRVQEKAKQVGFEWENVRQVRDKLEEEIAELDAELNAKEINKQKVEEEFGDVLFSMVNYARFLDIDPEKALELTNKKFISRFKKMEATVWADNKDMQDLSLQQLDDIWNKVKQQST